MAVGGANAPQRSPTQTLVPSGSIATPLVEPQVLPSGILAQFSIERYGLGSALVGARVCATAAAARSAAATPAAITNRRRVACDMMASPGSRHARVPRAPCRI